MEFTEADAFAAFGIEGENEQAVAEPAAPAAEPKPEEGSGEAGTEPAAEGAGTESGENGQEVAEPAHEGTDGQEPEAPKSKQTKEQNREEAAKRRRAEEAQRIEAAVQKAREEEQKRFKETMDAFFAKAGLKNPLEGNKPINSMEEFDAYQRAYQQRKAEQELKKGQLTPETISELIAQTPVMQKVMKAAEAAETAEREARDQKAKAVMQQQLTEIQKMDPSIQEAADLLKMPNAAKFYAYVKKGLSMTEAFYLANRETMEAKAQQAAQQKALNLANSKNHLSATGGRGKEPVAVPKGTMEVFRTMNPKATEAEIQAYYAKYQKGT